MMTGEREKELMSAAGMLLEARRTNTPIDDLPAAVRPVSLEEAYFIQDRLALAYGEIGGWKVGAPTAEATPMFAPMPRAWIASNDALLGGKLLSLLATSPAVVAAYAKRYKFAVSVIASAMAGRAVRRRPNLVFLGTTSLYDVAPAQYNRLRMPARLAGGRDGDEVAFLPLGRTVGFGSYHFSRETMASLEVVLARLGAGRPVNSIFGEGVNPKLRKVRTALDLLGMSSDALLQHRSPRMIYGVPLASNVRDILLGLASRPKPIIPPGPAATAAIIDFWRDRWLSKRIEREETIGAVARHSLAYPVRHGACVVLPPLPGEEGPLFAAVAALSDSAFAGAHAGAYVHSTPIPAAAAGTASLGA